MRDLYLVYVFFFFFRIFIYLASLSSKLTRHWGNVLFVPLRHERLTYYAAPYALPGTPLLDILFQTPHCIRFGAKRLRERVNRRFYAPAKRSATNVSIPLRGRHALIYEINNEVCWGGGGSTEVSNNCPYNGVRKMKIYEN